jgi:DNA-binding CsgD family transcriptional regulator
MRVLPRVNRICGTKPASEDFNDENDWAMTVSGRQAPSLTERQRQCLQGALALQSAKEIALELGISHHAVEKHLRIARDKFGATTTAEAARRFAVMESEGKPYGGSSDLVSAGSASDYRHILDHARRNSASGVKDAATGALFLEPSFTPLQTLASIAAVSLISIIALLLLIACAQGIEMLTMR